MYAQLDFINQRYKRVNLIGGEEVGIIPQLIEQYPNDFVSLEGREDVPLDIFEWYYDSEEDIFIAYSQIPPLPFAIDEPTQVDKIEANLDYLVMLNS